LWHLWCAVVALRRPFLSKEAGSKYRLSGVLRIPLGQAGSPFSPRAAVVCCSARLAARRAPVPTAPLGERATLPQDVVVTDTAAGDKGLYHT
jgi:hypothetical protein